MLELKLDLRTCSLFSIGFFSRGDQKQPIENREQVRRSNVNYIEWSCICVSVLSLSVLLDFFHFISPVS